MPFTALIPARMASSRLPNKPLVDIGGLPMVVRVAQQAAQATPHVIVAADDERILHACHAHGVQAIATRADHASGSDRLAEACERLELADDEIVVNVQGDEPLIDPALITAVAEQLRLGSAPMSTAAHPIDTAEDFRNPNVVKVVTNRLGQALYFSRAPIAFARDGSAGWGAALDPAAWQHPLRHIGIYGYRAGFLRQFPQLALTALEQTECLEQLRVLWHGHTIAVHVSPSAPSAGVDTPDDLARVRAIIANGI